MNSADPKRSVLHAAPWPPPRVMALAACGLVVGVTLAALVVPGNILLSVIFGVPLVLCVWVRSLHFLWGLTAVLLVLPYLLPYLGPPPTAESVVSVALINRALAALETVVIAALVHFRILGDRSLETHRQVLEEQNAELERLNNELTDREEEIVRQNEELQSQTEELERQSEELRVTNEELANREKMLEQLLELSRSLTAELTRDAMLKRICEALGTLTDGMASAILERHDQELTIPCHHGFGPDGPEPDPLPFAQSFAALVMAMGQTGYLEDLKPRPDIRVPRPQHGEPFRAVLAAPLRVHGQCVGTVELYSSQRQTWGESQIALVESLAAQASISLQSAELVETIRQERRRFEAAFRTVPFGVAVTDDPDGREVRLNPAAAALLGVPVGENVSAHTPGGIRLRRSLFQNDRPLPEERLPLRRALAGEEIQGEEVELVFPGSRRLVVLVSAAPIYDRHGRVAGAVSAFADITPQRELLREMGLRRREAEENSVRKTRFLAAVSHDIRTPVNAINLLAEVIRRSADTPALAPQVPEMAAKLQANAQSLVELVGDVLDIARFDTGKVELQESEFLLADLVNEECRRLQPLAEQKGLALLVSQAGRPIWLRTDRIKLGRVLGNLVGNAIKFTEQGTIEVRVETPPDRRIILRVLDSGVGIAPEHQARIFDEFAQLRNPERDRNKGSGLGLAICQRLVQVMGGTLTMSSTVGRGSEFTVTLPASCAVVRLEAEPPRPESKAEPARGEQLKGLRVLLVEDHATTRESTTQLLRQEGAEVLEASDGKTGLRLVQDGNAEVLLLDMNLPDLDGREVLQAIREQRPAGLKGVLVLTGDLTTERIEEVKRLGADALIGKPINVRQLIATLWTVRRGGADR